MKEKIRDKWLYLPILILGIYFLVRLIDQAKLLYIFPLDYSNDISSYMAQLYFLAECGFHTICPYWYNGFMTFQFTSPGWFFFTLPLYLIFKDVLIATYISMILIFVIGFIAFYFLGKIHDFSLTKRIAFFLLFFGNAIAIGNFIRLGDVHQLFAWTNFCILALIVLYYKNKRLDNSFFVSIIFLSIIILSHQTVTVLSFFLLLALFLVKKNIIDRIKIFIVGLVSLLLTSFWWITFIKNFGTHSISEIIHTETLFEFSGPGLYQNIATFLIPFIFLSIFYFYWKSYNKDRMELLFFIPFIFLALFLFFRVVYFIPILRYIYPDSYLYLFLFLSIFMLFKLNLDILNKTLKRMIFYGLVFICLVSVFVNIVHTDNFSVPGEIEKEMINMFEHIDDRFLILGNTPSTSYSKAYYSYAAIYYNLSTSGGWYSSTTKEYMDNLDKISTYLIENDCSNLINNLDYLKTRYILSYGSLCENLSKCGFIKKKESENICLYYL